MEQTSMEWVPSASDTAHMEESLLVCFFLDAGRLVGWLNKTRFSLGFEIKSLSVIVSDLIKPFQSLRYNMCGSYEKQNKPLSGPPMNVFEIIHYDGDDAPHHAWLKKLLNTSVTWSFSRLYEKKVSTSLIALVVIEVGTNAIKFQHFLPLRSLNLI